MASSSGSDANSVSQIWGPLCNCGRATTVVKAWTNENPGRRFFKCSVHGFFDWFDVERPYGWQKVSLLEARDEIRRQKDEIKVPKEVVGEMLPQMANRSTSVNSELVRKVEEEKKKLENDVMAANERENMLRQFVMLSWVGFIVVIAMILGIGKM